MADKLKEESFEELVVADLKMLLRRSRMDRQAIMFLMIANLALILIVITMLCDQK